MVTLAQAVTNTRSVLDETTATNRYWSNSELKTWINDAVRDIARRTETILIFNSSMLAIVGQAKYNLPSDVIRMHRVEFVPTNSNQVYPIIASTYDEMDQVWGINPTTQNSYPSQYACWGTPGNMTIQFYPVPAAGGIFNLYYYQMPQNLDTADPGADDSKQLIIPQGWDDLVVNYAAYRALTKARDDNWQTFKRMYDETLQYLIDVTRQAHDNGRFIQTMTGNVPSWLYAFSDE